MTQQALPDGLQRFLPPTPAVFFVLFSLSVGDKHGYAIMQKTNHFPAAKFAGGPGPFTPRSNAFSISR